MHIPISSAARLLGVSTEAVRKMIKSGTMPCLKATALGRASYRIPLDQFFQWIESEIERIQKQAEKRLNRLKRAKGEIEKCLMNVQNGK